MTHAYEVEGTAAGGGLCGPSAAEDSERSRGLRSLDTALHGMRRLAVRPPAVDVPVPGVGRTVDFAKLLACGAVHELSATPDPVTIKSLATAMTLEHSTVSRLVSEAASDGLMRRAPHADDKRSTVVTLTDEGRAAAEGFKDVRLIFLNALTKGWSSAEIVAFAELMDKFVTSANDQRLCWMRAPETDAKPQ